MNYKCEENLCINCNGEKISFRNWNIISIRHIGENISYMSIILIHHNWKIFYEQRWISKYNWNDTQIWKIWIRVSFKTYFWWSSLLVSAAIKIQWLFSDFDIWCGNIFKNKAKQKHKKLIIFSNTLTLNLLYLRTQDKTLFGNFVA